MSSKALAIDTQLEARLSEIKDNDDNFVSVREIKNVVQSVMDTLKGDLTATDIQLFMELESLAHYIDMAKRDIASLRPDSVRDEYIPSATDELDAIVESTAEATNRIMDCAESIEKEFPNMPPEVSDRLAEVTTNIFEACGFQDITGQRITKVVKVLKDIEEKITQLVDAFGAEIDRIKEDEVPLSAQEDDSITDEDLLHGPQLKDEAKSQEEIDALLASFD